MRTTGPTATDHRRARRGGFALACFAFLVLAALGTGAPLAGADTPPAVTIAAPSSVTFDSAHLSGEVDPQGGPSETFWQFQYSTDDSSWQPVGSPESAGSGSGLTPVETELAGLAPGTEYFVRLVATNEEGANESVSPGPDPSFETEAVAAPQASGLAVSAVTAESAHFAGTVNSGGSGAGEAAGTYRFQCEPSCPTAEAPHEFGAEGFADGSGHAVEADATGLEPSLAYTVKLIVDNAAGEASEQAPFTTLTVAPDLATAVTGNPLPTSAWLNAYVNPHNATLTECKFEYGPTAAYGQEAPCETTPSGNVRSVVSADVKGLQPQTVYHYRLVAADSAGTEEGEDQSFETLPAPPSGASCANEARRVEQESTYLADCRAYELVSSADTALPVNWTGPLSPDGEHVLYGYLGGSSDTTSGATSWLFASRGPGGWSSHSILPPASAQYGPTYQIVNSTPDLAEHLFSSSFGLTQQFISPSMALERLDDAGNQTTLQSDMTVFGESGAEFVTSDDLSHVLGNTPDRLDPSQTPGTLDVYDFGSGTPQLVSVMPSTGHAPACGVLESGFAASSNRAAVFEHWVSTNGNRAFFVTRGDVCSPASAHPRQLYMRDLETGTTTLISGPVAVGIDRGLNAEGRFLGATPDGSQVFYRTVTSYDPADTNTTADIYRYTVGSGNKCITCTPGATAEIEAGNPNSAVAEDGSRVYFVSTAQINGEGNPGDSNLYVWEAATETIHYVVPGPLSITPITVDGGALNGDGSVFLFQAERPELNALTGSDNGGLRQLYRYDDADQTLTCVSCPPDGSPATAEIQAGLVRSDQTIIDRRTPMSADGSVIAFRTFDPLLPHEDVNNGPDLYEWHDGTLSLLTSGTHSYNVGSSTVAKPELVAVSPSGRDIVIQSIERLTPEPQEDWIKVFDAREGGGFAPPSPAAAACEGEECRGEAAPAGATGPAASSAFAGVGNLHGHHRRDHKRRRRRRHHRAKSHQRANANRRASR